MRPFNGGPTHKDQPWKINIMILLHLLEGSVPLLHNPSSFNMQNDVNIELLENVKSTNS